MESQVDIDRLQQARKVEQLAKSWLLLTGNASPKVPALTLYKGRSIAHVLKVANGMNSQWYVVSAGLGLVRCDQRVPAYECTVASGSPLDTQLRRMGATSVDWWNAITADSRYPISRIVSRFPALIALPSAYLRMAYDDLSRVSADDAKRLRIFTSAAGARQVPKHLGECVMPYDNRLDATSEFAGTQSDFAQRALRHFVEALHAASLPLEEARAAVVEAFVRQAFPIRTEGRRMSDEDIRHLIATQWPLHAGQSARLLRYLRDEAGVACEQKRFSRIWRALATERGE